MVKLVTQPLVVGAGQDLVGQVDQHDMFVRPGGGDLSGEFQSDRAGAQQHDPVGALEVGVRGAVAADGINSVWLVALGREGVGRAGRKDDVCLLYTSPSPRDGLLSRMPSSA